MTQKGKLTLIYGTVAVLSTIILSIAMFLRSRLPEADLSQVSVNSGKQKEMEWFPIGRDLEGLNQDGQKVKLSDLKGKVWLVAEFFAVCPHCAQRNGAELRAIYDTFKDNPDFQIVCISVDPTVDTHDKLKDYATALGADTKNWWFFNAGDEKATHEYLEKELKFFGIRERKDPADIEANGRFAHDLSFLMVDRDWKVVGKWPLADARSEDAKQRDPGLYDRLKQDLFSRVKEELAKPATTVSSK